MKLEPTENDDAGVNFARELSALLDKYSGKMSMFEAIGIMELMKSQMISGSLEQMEELDFPL